MNERSLPLNSIRYREPDSSDSFIDLDRLIVIIARRTKVIAICIVAFMMLGATYLLFTTPVYTSMTQILLDEDLSKFAEADPSQQSKQQADTQISSAVEILKSGTLALRVADEMNLADNDTIQNPPQSPVGMVKSALKSIVGLLSSDPSLSEEQIHNGRRQKAAAILQQSLAVERVARSGVVALSFRSTDPVLAAKITRAYADAYLTDQLNANFDATERATVWLQERLDDLRQRAQVASLEVEKYRAENGLTSARGELMSEQQLADLNSQLIIAQADTASASARYNQFQSIVDQGPEAAVQNATVSSKETDNSTIRDLRNRYLTISKREQEVTDTFGADHPQAVALKAEKTDVTNQIYQELQQLTSSYRNEYEVARSREASLRNSIDGVTGRNTEANKSLVHLRELEQKSTALKTLYESYLGRYEEVSQQRSFPIAKARVISEAGVPVSPSSPKKTMVLALSAILGMMFGGALAFFQEMRERYFRLEGDVRTILGHKSLGYLPVLRDQPRKPKNVLHSIMAKQSGEEPETDDAPFESAARVVLDAPRSHFAETLRNAKLASDVVLQGRQSRVIGIVSAVPGEGKSTVSANFAFLLAASGKRTLLIDADLRNPGLSRMLTPAPQTGLVEVALEEVPWTSGIKLDRQTKLAILPVARRASHEHLHHTNELLASQGMANLIENVRKSFDYIVVDLAPMGPVVDAKAFSPHVDGFIFVVEWGKTPSKLVHDILDAEPQVNSKILGVVLNKTDMEELKKYGHLGGSEKFRANYDGYYTDHTDGRAAT
ncbi:polysaccharide biosynthesis tyrosine autokinase [Rhizobiaceae bacterium n13]|uniref:non-specific protein-tyrosine kinase n=1 Tax=Ferirhizobium litorale TaxID=2927786 RepID=A0AAE3U1N9_9HYPH|nr:polysaccharide biosynthesis tyrosine autokinase [Fererhizobium litorale]MDI7862067.1 polysaccharide biosynthesis tyrosine autokinase [Fererhizobium litorale]MDI7922661.1 polysaccharide biosynthesis tyrosine autokinase [Fererhizobium litorale]